MHQTTLPRVRQRPPSLVFVLLACSAVLAGLLIWPAREIPAQLKGPKTIDRYVTQTVAIRLQSDHLSKQPLNDVIARRGLKTFLRMMDPIKLYLLQSDVDEFSKHCDRLDDYLKQGDISQGYKMFNRYLQRLDSRVAEVDELLEMDHDFSLDERLITDPDHTTFSANDAEAKDRLRRRIKYELMLRKADGEDVEEARKGISRRYHNFAKRRHQTDSDELMEMYLTAMTSSFDPHTTFMSRDTLENFHINMKLNLEGIGAALQVKDGYTIVTKVIPGGAADKMGQLKPEDHIVSVGQDEDGEMVDVIDMKLKNVVKLIRGKAGTIVRLGVVPSGSTETKIYTITRARIELKDAEARGEVFEEKVGPDGPTLRIGVIDLPSFYMDMSGARRHLTNFKSTTRDVQRILDGFKEQGVDAVILDLSRNGGGSLTEAINLTGLFIEEGPVVQVKDSDGRIHRYNDHDRGIAWERPLVVLTSKFSASASEILAGAVQDYVRGIVVGDQATHGKGTVQSLLDIGSQLHRRINPPNYGALKITMQQFYRPNGESTQKKGVIADVVLPSLSTHMDIGESDLDYSIDFDEVESVLSDEDKFAMVNDELVSTLRAESAERLKKSADFQKLLKTIDRYIEQKKRVSVTLNEEEFLKERAEWNADKEQEKELQNQFEMDRPVFERDNYYNAEVMAITLDYVRYLQKNNNNVAQVNKRGVDPGGS